MSGLNMALGRGAPGLRPCGKAVPMPLPAARRPCRAATFKTCAVMQAELAPAATARVVLGGGVADPATVSVPSYVAAASATATPDKPGVIDRQYFKQHWSVEFWRDFAVPETISDPNTPLPSRLQAVVQTLSEAASSIGVFSNSKAAAYWGYHITRSSFFALQGIAGLLAARTASGITGRGPADETGIKLESMVRAGLTYPVGEALAMYYQDWRNICEGVYALPWDMTTRGHRQFSPLWVARRSAQFVAEASATLSRRGRGQAEDVWLKSPLYPDYYLNTFHYQTDGWLSDASARVYEVSTETLFLGRQDAMQRQSLVPLREFMADRSANSGAGTSLLEVAGGTGRFATFLKDNYPRMDVTVLDLSPYYLQEARRNMQYWADMRAPKGESLGGPDGVGVSFLQAAAEAIPQPDETYDVVSCIYLFHELPPAVRRAAAKEMARVLKPGGMLILTDSIQLGDRPRSDGSLVAFEQFNEPYYRTYIAEDFGKMFSEVGLEPATKVLGSSTKVLSFRKPKHAPAPKQAPPAPAAAAETSHGAASPLTAGEEQAEAVGTVLAS